ncbi:MAG: PEGA domain-containing protein [Terriglobia bacterium]
MHRYSYMEAARIQGLGRLPAVLGRSAALVLILFFGIPGFAAQVHVRDGQLVRVKLRNILTTENIRKGDRIEFEVTEEILVSGHVVIAKGSVAQGKILDVKGTGKPKAKDAEVVFQFTTVRAVDNQEIPLRLQGSKSRKENAKGAEVAERSPIPGYPTRLIGAEKGKEYTVYTDGSFAINAADAVAVPPAATSAGAPAAVAAPAAPTAAVDVGMEPASVEFNSEPKGADILIDGTFVGNTPSTLRMTPGRHNLEIRLTGYRSWTRTMVVDPESHPAVRATLVKE